jgi:hypothetical protein
MRRQEERVIGTQSDEEGLGCFSLQRRYPSPIFPSILARAGILCTLVDDSHFMALGFKEDDLYGRDEGAELFTFGDDGEKFGLWSRTFRHCYEDRWLGGLFFYLREK